MPFGLGVVELILIFLALLLIFGAKKIPLIARGLGESIKNFKGEVRGGKDDHPEPPPRLEDGER